MRGRERLHRNADAPGLEIETYSFSHYTNWYFTLDAGYVADGLTPRAVVTIILNRDTDAMPEWPEQIVIGQDYGAALLVQVSGAVNAGDVAGPGDLCGSTGAMTFTGTTADGDRVASQLTYAQSCGISGNTTCYRLVRMELELGGTSHVITDPLQLVYSAQHHNFDQRFLGVLDEPVDGAFAILVEEPPWDATTQPGYVVRLGAALEELSRTPTVTWTRP